MSWKHVASGIWLFTGDSCNVYAVVGTDDRCVVIDSGSGEWLSHLDTLPASPVALLCTHYFRDHSAGAAAAAQAGIPVWVPQYEKQVFENPGRHFAQRETYIIYDNVWDLFAPVTPTVVSGILEDYDRVHFAGLTFDVIPLPGVTLSQSGFGVTLPGGKRVVFCGEAIHSPGKLARIAPLQYNYNDLSGAAQCYYSALELSTYAPDLLLPGLGTPILEEIELALSSLRENLRHLVSVRPGLTGIMDHLRSGPALERVTDHVWRDAHSVANTWYLISESGKALAIDYGYHSTTSGAWQQYSKPERRRALLHGLDGLKRQFGIDKIDVVLVSHFHDDHVCGIPVLQRLFGTECWAAENFADLLERPEAHCFPCNWPTAAKIDRRLDLNQPFSWEEYTFTLQPMNGHTRFAALIGFEADGKRFAHTGDQYFFYDGVDTFETNRRAQNHVFRNGALLNGYEDSGRWMLEYRPDVVIQGHQAPMWTDSAFFRHIAEWTNDYAETARRVTPLGDEEVHFNLDSWGGWIWPYRTEVTGMHSFELTVTLRNPLPTDATLEVSAVLPAGWTGSQITLNALARQEVTGNITITPPVSVSVSVETALTPGIHPIAIDVTINGKRFGQVAEALLIAP